VANTSTRLTGDNRKGLTERGIHSLLSWKNLWDTATTLYAVVDTAEQGAGSICFSIINSDNPADLECDLQVSNDGDNWANCPFKDETGTETAAGAGFTVNSATIQHVIVTYSDYPRYAAFRFFRLSMVPSAAVANCLVHAVLK